MKEACALALSIHIPNLQTHMILASKFSLTPSMWILTLGTSRKGLACRLLELVLVRLLSCKVSMGGLRKEPPFQFCPERTPSSRRTSNRLAGRASILQNTRVRHSGHLSSLWALKILCRHGLQKVCWQGRTLAVTSSFSKHTGHSRRSSSVKSSILF